MYVGEYKDLLRDGHGLCTFPGNCFHYSGEWHRGKMHGQGKFSMGDGMVYEGEFYDGEIEGVGLKRWADGSSYNGHFHQGEMHGEGVYLSARGERYEGHWENNQRCGHGELLFPNGDTYSGDFSAHRPHGRGKMVYAATSNVYEGEWAAAMRSGNGILCDSQGNRLYDGCWVDNHRHGNGIGVLPIVNYTPEAGKEPNSLWYEGKWINHQPEVRTTKLVVKIEPNRPSSGTANGTQDELRDLPDQLVIENKQLPVLVVVCVHEAAEHGVGMNESVQGEHGRRLRMRIFEGTVPQQSTEAGGAENNVVDTLTASAWQFISNAVNSASRINLLHQLESEISLPSSNQYKAQEKGVEPDARDSTPDASGGDATESGDAEVPMKESQVPSETRLDEVTVEATGGLAMFRDLSLPAATLIGDYYLVCESMTSDSLPPVFIALSVK